MNYLRFVKTMNTFIYLYHFNLSVWSILKSKYKNISDEFPLSEYIRDIRDMSVRFMNIRHLLMVDIVRQYRELVHVHLSRILHSEPSMVPYSSLTLDVYPREIYRI